MLTMLTNKWGVSMLVVGSENIKVIIGVFQSQ